MPTENTKKTPPASFNKLMNEVRKVKEVPYGTSGRFGNGAYSFRSKNHGLSIDEVKRISRDLNVEGMRKASAYYYESFTSYRRIVDHFAGIFLYYYYLSLDGLEDTEPDEVRKKYSKALSLLDNFCGGGTFRTIATEVLVNGAYFGYLNFGKEQTCTLTLLNPSYCRSRYKSIYGTDLVEFDTSYFTTVSNAVERVEVLKRVPSEVREHYLAFLNGKIESPWVVFPPHTACAFFMDSSDGPHCPPLFDTVIDILNYNDEKEIEMERDEQQLEKLLVQRFKLDQDGDLELFLEELAEIQKATAAMFHENKYVDVLTTIAEQVEMIDSRSGSNNSTATNNNIVKMMLPKYENAGISSEIFYSTTATAANISIQNTSSFMSKLNDKFSRWLEIFLLGNISFGKLRPKVEILPITWYNREKITKEYLLAAQSGYSKILPYVAVGNKQSTLASMLTLENDILGLQDKLIPLSNSYTQSAGDQKPTSNPNNPSLRVEGTGGAPEKDSDEKTEESVRTTDARGES